MATKGTGKTGTRRNIQDRKRTNRQKQLTKKQFEATLEKVFRALHNNEGVNKK